MMRLWFLAIIFSVNLFGQSHAYWRLSFTQQPAGGGLIVVDLISFFDSASTLIPTTGGTSSASSTQSGSTPANAFDGSVNGVWWISNTAPTTATPIWIQYQFASPVAVNFVKLFPRQNFANQWPCDFKLQYSDDGVTFTTFFTVYGMYYVGNIGTADPTEGWNLNLTNTMTTIGQAYRWLVTGTQGSGQVGINSITMKDCASASIATPLIAAPTSSTSGTGNANPGGSAAFQNGSCLSGSFCKWVSANTPTVGSPEYVAYVFPSLQGISSFTITATSNAQGPTTFSLQSSTDLVSWSTVQSYTAATWAGSPQTFTVTPCTGATPTQIGVFLTGP